MSFLSETVLTGSTRLCLGGQGDTATKDGRKTLRKSESHASLLSPLIQLVRDPVRAVGNVVDSLSYVSEAPIIADSAIDRKQVLYLRMRNVSVSKDTCCLRADRTLSRHNHMKNGRLLRLR